MKLAAWAVMVCILEDPHEQRHQAASKTAPAAKEETGVHRMIY